MNYSRLKCLATLSITLVALLQFQIVRSQDPGLDDWENPHILSRNKLDTRATFWHFNNREDALNKDRDQSSQ